MRYGIPYKGSKNRIADWVVDNLPASDTLVDIFAGGCAVTHAAILSHKWKRVIANDLLPAPNVFQDAMCGRFHDVDMVTTREQFFSSNDFATRLIYSYGNNTVDYLYSRDIERVKIAAERMIVAKTPRQRRLMYMRFITELGAYLHDGGTTKCLRNLQGLEGLERLQGLQGLQGLGRLEVSNIDYRDVTIPSGATVYADPPHRGTRTNQYHTMFDYDAFEDWLNQVDFPVFVSEYTCPKGCVELTRKESVSLADHSNGTRVVEGLFVQERFRDVVSGGR